MSFVTTHWIQRTAVLTLSRPDKRNAMHEPLWRDLGDAARALVAQSPRAVIVTGSGDHFCAGMDLSFNNPLLATIAQCISRQDEAAVGELIDWLNAQIGALCELACPTIAAIEGVCAGSGLELALACDLRVVASDAKLSLPETRVGLCPDVGGARRLHAIVGPARAADLICTARTLDADEASGWGLVDRSCEPGSALNAALELAQQTRASAPIALAHTLTYLRSLSGVQDPAVRQAERTAGIAAVMGGEALQGAAAFAQRTLPAWTQDESSS